MDSAALREPRASGAGGLPPLPTLHFQHLLLRIAGTFKIVVIGRQTTVFLNLEIQEARVEYISRPRN